jgi:hypothetical protein
MERGFLGGVDQELSGQNSEILALDFFFQLEYALRVFRQQTMC